MVRAVKTQAVFFSVYVCVVEVGGGEYQEGEASVKRGDAVRSDPERRLFQSAQRELWEGSPFTLSLFLQSCHS